MHVQALLVLCCTVPVLSSGMDDLARQMFDKLKEEHGIDTPEGEEEIRQLIMNAQKSGVSESQMPDGDGSQTSSGDESQISAADGSQTSGGNAFQMFGGDGSQMSDGGGSQVFGGNAFQMFGGDGFQTFGGSGFQVFGGDGSQQQGVPEQVDFMEDITQTEKESEEMVEKDNSDTVADSCTKTDGTRDMQYILREKYEQDLFEMKAQIRDMHKAINHCVPRGQYHQDIANLKASIGDQSGGTRQKESPEVNSQMVSLQQSLHHVLQKLRVYDTKIEELTTAVSVLKDNYARNTVHRCQSGRFSGCECSKCCGQNTWNCDGTKEIYYPEPFHRPPAITISVGSFKKTKNIDHPVIYYDVSKESFKLQYLPKDHFVELEEVQVNWMACA